MTLPRTCYPVIRGTIDERLFRTVKRREKWLEFLLGAAPGFSERSLTDEEPPPLPNRLGGELAIDLRSPSRSVGSISTGALNETSRRRLPRSRLPTIKLLGQRGASTAVREIQVKESQEIPPSQVPTMGTSREPVWMRYLRWW